MQASEILQQAAAKVLGRTRQQVMATCDQITAEAKPVGVGRQIHKILSQFLLTQELPHTRWSFCWGMDAEGATRATLRATAKSMCADFQTAISQSEFWGAPISVSALLPELDLGIPVWNRKTKGSETAVGSLAGYEITQVEESPSRQRIVLRRIGKNKSKHSLRITLVDANQGSPTIVLLDEQQAVLGDTHVLRSDEKQLVATLWDLIMEERSSLVVARCAVKDVSFANQNINTMDNPSEAAEAMLAMVAPLAREIRLRSRVPGELILKRNIGEGRREEIFMSRDALQEHYASLPDRYRRVYDSMGLGNESTCDFVTMIGHELKSPPRERSQPRTPLARKAPEPDSMDMALDSVLLDIEAA
jgi:hypothetical protein